MMEVMTVMGTKHRVTLEEQETSISMCPLDKEAMVYSCVPRMMQRLDKLAEEYPDQCHTDPGDGLGVICYVPASWVSIRPPRKCNKTPEERAATAARLNAAKKAKREKQHEA